MISSIDYTYRLPLKLTNVATYWSLVVFHLYNTFWYEPEYMPKETYLTPGEYAYWTWPLIHGLLLGYTVVQWLPSAQELVIDAIGYSFALVGISSAAFLYLTIRGWDILAFLSAILLSSTVSKIFSIVRSRRRPLNPSPTIAEDFWGEALIHLPFSLYHAWSIVLIILSIFQAFGKDVHKEHPTVFTDIFVFLAEIFFVVTSWGYAYASTAGDLAGTVVITYVLFAIFEHQHLPFIRWSAFSMAILSSFSFLFTLQKTYVHLSERHHVESQAAKTYAHAREEEEREPLVDPSSSSASA